MTTDMRELADLWFRFKMSAAFCGVPNEHLPIGVAPDDYGWELMEVWDEIDALPGDAGPAATLLKTAAALRGGWVAYERKSTDFEGAMLLAEILIADMFRGDTKSAGLSAEMKRSSVLTISEVLRAAADDLPGEGNDGRMYESALETWLLDFGVKESLAAAE
jgi:hypothetical protein